MYLGNKMWLIWLVAVAGVLTALIGVFLLSGVCLALSSHEFDLYGYYNNLQVIVQYGSLCLD